MIIIELIKSVIRSLGDLFNQPHKVLLLCLAFSFVNLVIDGSLLRLWSLSQEYKHVRQESAKVLEQSKELKMKIKKASDLDFLELEARNRFNYVGENDLVFVFSEE